MDLSEIIGQISADNAEETLENFRSKQALFRRISIESEKYIDAPSSEWPSIEFNWDLSKEGQRHSLDGERPKRFEEFYPSGFLLGWVALQEFGMRNGVGSCSWLQG